MTNLDTDLLHIPPRKTTNGCSIDLSDRSACCEEEFQCPAPSNPHHREQIQTMGVPRVESSPVRGLPFANAHICGVGAYCQLLRLSVCLKTPAPKQVDGLWLYGPFYNAMFTMPHASVTCSMQNMARQVAFWGQVTMPKNGILQRRPQPTSAGVLEKKIAQGGGRANPFWRTLGIGDRS